MRKFCYYRKLQRPEAWSPKINRYLVEPSISTAGDGGFGSANPNLHCIHWRDCRRLHPESTTSNLDAAPKGKNIREEFQAGSPESPS